MLESKLQSKILRKLESFKSVWVIKTMLCNKRGVPDILFLHHGRFFALEIKKDNKTLPSAAQKFNIEKINECGGYAFIVGSFETFERICRINGIQ